LQNKPPGCGASVASAAGPFTKKNVFQAQTMVLALEKGNGPWIQLTKPEWPKWTFQSFDKFQHKSPKRLFLAINNYYTTADITIVITKTIKAL
jgi:hypothetical protein